MNKHRENPRASLWSSAAQLIFVVACLAISGNAQQQRETASELERLVEAERAFAHASVANGMRAAFLEYFAPDGINFTPHPANTRATLSARPAPTGRPPIILDWHPAFADISLAGDMGYTTGPYTLRDSRQNNKLVGSGYYFSIWKKQMDGTWRVAVDYGIETAITEESPAAIKLQPSHWFGYQPKRDGRAGRETLIARDQEFSAATLREEASRAYSRFTSWDNETRVYRDQQAPALGRKHITEAVAREPVRFNSQPIDAAVATSGDLAYSYGKWQTSGSTPAQSGYYVRVWRLIRGKWLVVAEICNPLPRE